MNVFVVYGEERTCARLLAASLSREKAIEFARDYFRKDQQGFSEADYTFMYTVCGDRGYIIRIAAVSFLDAPLEMLANQADS